MTSPSSMHETGHQDNPEGWDGEGGGRAVCDGGGYKWAPAADSCPCTQKTAQCCIAISLQLKLINLKKELCCGSQWKKWTKKKGDVSSIGFGSKKLRTEKRHPDVWMFGSHLCLDKSRFWRMVWAKAWLIEGTKESEMVHIDSPFEFWCKIKRRKSSPITLAVKKKRKKEKKSTNSVINMSLCIWWKLPILTHVSFGNASVAQGVWLTSFSCLSHLWLHSINGAAAGFLGVNKKKKKRENAG